MGVVSDSVNAGRASPLAPLPSASALIDLMQPEATAGWSVPPVPIRDRAGLPDAPAPKPGQLPSEPPGQPQLQALALLLSQTSAQSLTISRAKPPPRASSAEAVGAAKTNGGAAKKAFAAKQFQLARKLYDGDDEWSPLISIVG